MSTAEALAEALQALGHTEAAASIFHTVNYAVEKELQARVESSNV